MATVRDICTRASVLAGISANGEALSPEDADFAFDTLNEMVDSWSADSQFIYVTDDIFATVAGTTFTVGPGGNFNVSYRPTVMQPGAYSVLNGISYPFRWITQAEYNLIPYKANPGPNPWVAFYNPDIPLGSFSVFPIITTPLEVHIITLQQLTQFANLSTVYAFPPGYLQAITFSLAELLCAGVRPVDPVVAITASGARSVIQTVNVQVPVLQLPGAVLQPWWNGYYYQ